MSLLALLGFHTAPVAANYTDSKPRGTKSTSDSRDDWLVGVEGYRGTQGSQGEPVKVFVAGKEPDASGACADGRVPAIVGYRTKVCIETQPFEKGMAEILVSVPGKVPEKTGDKLACESTPQLKFKDEPVYYGATPVCVVEEFLDPSYADSKYGAVAVKAWAYASKPLNDNGTLVCDDGKAAVDLGSGAEVCPYVTYESKPYTDAKIDYYDAKKVYEKTSKDDPDYSETKKNFEETVNKYSESKADYYESKAGEAKSYMDSKKYLNEVGVDYFDAKAAYTGSKSKPTYSDAKQVYQDLKSQYEEAKTQYESKATKASLDEVKSAVEVAKQDVKDLRAVLKATRKGSVSYTQTRLEYRAAVKVLQGAKRDRTMLLKKK